MFMSILAATLFGGGCFFAEFAAPGADALLLVS
jgi:hypothetical protein